MSAKTPARESLSVVPKGCQVTLWAIFILGALALLWVYWLMPRAIMHLEGGPNRLKVLIVDETGAPITNGSIVFSFGRGSADHSAAIRSHALGE
jgi:hypothetical protein